MSGEGFLGSRFSQDDDAFSGDAFRGIDLNLADTKNSTAAFSTSPQESLAIDPRIFAASGDLIALRVEGDSMIQAGILDGDVVILKRTESADSGDIVVALIDSEEATLKRLRKRGNSIALEAANPAYETRIFGPDRVRIQGKLVAMIRRYS